MDLWSSIVLLALMAGAKVVREVMSFWKGAVWAMQVQVFVKPADAVVMLKGAAFMWALKGPLPV